MQLNKKNIYIFEGVPNSEKCIRNILRCGIIFKILP